MTATIARLLLGPCMFVLCGAAPASPGSAPAPSGSAPELTVAPKFSVSGSVRRSQGPGESMGCEKVVMEPVDVVTYFETAVEVPTSTFHDESIVLPCAFSGRMLREGKSYEWSINAGGAGYLRSEDGLENKLFICRTACEKALPKLMGL